MLSEPESPVSGPLKDSRGDRYSATTTLGENYYFCSGRGGTVVDVPGPWIYIGKYLKV